MVATWNPAADAAYYLREAQASYYVVGREPPGVWYTPAANFGLVNGTPVESRTFEHLFAGRDAAGRPLVARASGHAKRVPAFDFTFSAPRSLALLWALSDDATRTCIGAAQRSAVCAALKVLQREAAFARRGRAGRSIEPVDLTTALFQHGESRPAVHHDGAIFADPNLHTHALVVNIAARADGTIGALHSVVLRNAKMLAGAAYHASLSHELQTLGFGIDRIGRNGIFEIVGISDAAVEYFSARRNEIAAELEVSGTTSAEAPALAATIARATRAAKTKGELCREDIWRDAAKRIGLDIEVVLLRQLQRNVVINRAAGERLLAERLKALPRALTETRSVIDRQEVVRATAEALVGTGLGPDRIEVEVDKLLRDGHVVEVGRDALGLPRFSTPELVTIEHEASAMAQRLVHHNGIGLDPADVKARAVVQALSYEQTEAALAATGSARLAVVQGAPGTGKTTLLRPIVEAWQSAGYRVVGAASAWRVANALSNDLQIEARATASWLTLDAAGRPFLDNKSFLVLDEAGLLGSRETHALLTAVEKAGARFLAVGDLDQLQSIAAGSGLSILARSAEAARVTAIVRQREAWARDAVAHFGRGAANEALDAYAAQDRLIEADGARAAICSAVDHVESDLLGGTPSTALIVVKTNTEAAAIGHEVRRRLRERGLITGTDILVDAVTPSGHCTSVSLAVGDRIRFLARINALGVVNGTIATVTRVNSAEREERSGTATPRHACVEALIEGRLVAFDTRDLADASGRARLGWAYASTVYGAQGMTVERASVLLTPAFDRHDIYVAASRARGATMLVVDRRALDQEIGNEDAPPGPSDRKSRAEERGVRRLQGTAPPRLAESGRSTTLDTPHMAAPLNPVVAEDRVVLATARRRAFLASRLARANVKETTLDVIMPPDVKEASAVPRQLERGPTVSRRQTAARTVTPPDAPTTPPHTRRLQRRQVHDLEL